MGLVLFEVPGIIRQRAVSEGGRGALSVAAVASTRYGTRAYPHCGNRLGQQTATADGSWQ
ncbi:hypothetical protein X777_03778 [Ooceraea biroi]|uniref:Uncharacterized protein n=1 Tax=Ooceraea biroi TaxID=2015173 RepID=A0A026WK98_OOCBI|nr:hypothetical protein X777_03778 [Ooceraea biroi]